MQRTIKVFYSPTTQASANTKSKHVLQKRTECGTKIESYVVFAMRNWLNNFQEKKLNQRQKKVKSYCSYNVLRLLCGTAL